MQIIEQELLNYWAFSLRQVTSADVLRSLYYSSSSTF